MKRLKLTHVLGVLVLMVGQAGTASAMVALPAAAPTGMLFAINLTKPSGAVVLGTHLWASDNLNRFCRIDTPRRRRALHRE